MRKVILSLVVLFYAFWIFPTNSNAQIEDGTYSINYQVNKAGDISASIANDYFVKPAKLFVENGKMRMQLTVKQSSWVTEFTSPHGGNKKISEDKAANTRLVEFAVTGINSPTVIKMKVDIDEMNYHHTYSTDFVWDASSLKLLEAAKKPEPVKEQPKAEEPKKEEPKPAVKTEVTTKSAPAPVATPAPVKTEQKPAEVKEQPKAEVKATEETKVAETKATEAKAEVATEKEEEKKEAAKQEQVADEPKQEDVAVAKAEEKAEEKAENPQQTATVTEEIEKAEAAEPTKSSSNIWIYVVIVLVVVGAGTVFMRKRSQNKA